MVEDNLLALENAVEPYVTNLLHKKVIRLSSFVDKPVSVYLLNGEIIDGVLTGVNGSFLTMIQDDDTYSIEDIIVLEQVWRIRHARILTDEEVKNAESKLVEI
ncbi:MAG: hypothetical protein PHF76_11750 [Bacteroidales bacterium]|nr:hypothetical protein [Bacteroidales bacterium]